MEWPEFIGTEVKEGAASGGGTDSALVRRVDFEDIMYAVRVVCESPDDVTVKFSAVRISGFAESGAHVYAKDDERGCSGVTDDFDDANVFLSGRIKWDGCADMKFDEQETVMLHFCGRNDVANLGALLPRLYDLAAELMPEHADELD
jgi:hypothetical protein